MMYEHSGSINAYISGTHLKCKTLQPNLKHINSQLLPVIELLFCFNSFLTFECKHRFLYVPPPDSPGLPLTQDIKIP